MPMEIKSTVRSVNLSTSLKRGCTRLVLTSHASFRKPRNLRPRDLPPALDRAGGLESVHLSLEGVAMPTGETAVFKDMLPGNTMNAMLNAGVKSLQTNCLTCIPVSKRMILWALGSLLQPSKHA